MDAPVILENAIVNRTKSFLSKLNKFFFLRVKRQIIPLIRFVTPQDEFLSYELGSNSTNTQLGR